MLFLNNSFKVGNKRSVINSYTKQYQDSKKTSTTNSLTEVLWWNFTNMTLTREIVSTLS